MLLLSLLSCKLSLTSFFMCRTDLRRSPQRANYPLSQPAASTLRAAVVNVQSGQVGGPFKYFTHIYFLILYLLSVFGNWAKGSLIIKNITRPRLNNTLQLCKRKYIFKCKRKQYLGRIHNEITFWNIAEVIDKIESC